MIKGARGFKSAFPTGRNRAFYEEEEEEEEEDCLSLKMFTANKII